MSSLVLCLPLRSRLITVNMAHLYNYYWYRYEVSCMYKTNSPYHNLLLLRYYMYCTIQIIYVHLRRVNFVKNNRFIEISSCTKQNRSCKYLTKFKYTNSLSSNFCAQCTYVGDNDCLFTHLILYWRPAVLFQYN